MQRLTFTNASGESVTLGRTFPYLLQNIEGVGAVASTLLSQRGFQQDGVTYLGSLLEPRMVHFRVIIQDGSREGLLAKRAEILRVFNARLGQGVLRYEDDVTTYRIEAAVCDGPNPITGVKGESATMQSFDIGLYCAKPAWESEEAYEVSISSLDGGMELPLRLPFSLAEMGKTKQIDYQGTLDAPLLVVFDGPAVMPKLTKRETGEYMEVNVALQEGEKLYLDTTPSAINVYTVDANGAKQSAFNYINPQTSYFMLTQGMNTISFSASDGEPKVHLYWRTQYVGV